MYIEIMCPHCRVKFVDLPAESIVTSKASKCKQHLERCAAAKAAGVVVQPPQPPATAVSSAIAVTAVPAVPPEIQAQLDALHARADWAERRIGAYDAILTQVLPSFQPPLNENTGRLQLTEAIKIDMLPSLLPAPVDVAPWPPEATRAAQELAALRHERAKEQAQLKDAEQEHRDLRRRHSWLLKLLERESAESGMARMLLNSYSNKFSEPLPKRVRFG